MNHFTDVKVFIDFIEHQKRFSKKTSLAKMEFFAKIFDHPENKFPTIHITGTNGKGSTVSYLKEIYLLKGLNVGTFTSPYVVKFNERITYNGEYISDEDLLKYGNIIIDHFDDFTSNGFEEPTFFELITMIAFLYFADKKDLDLAIIEVGMGGRLDATNIIHPMVSAITNVSLEHMAQLGPTVEAILNEKLGIVKPNSHFVTSIKEDNLLIQCKKKCKELNTTFNKVDFESLKILKSDLSSTDFSYKGKNISINMLGIHQCSNACLAAEIVEIINENYGSKFNISCELLLRGLLNTFWPGRLEKVSDDPLIYLDGGHNIDCIKTICDFVKELKIPYKRCVTSISHDKELKTMIGLLDDTFDEIIFTKYSYKRSADAVDIYDLSNCKNKLIIESVDDVYNYLNNHKVDFTLVIGSLYLVSEIRPKYKMN